jgi:hypothetical protein
MEREELLALLSTYLDLQPTYRKDELKTLCPFTQKLSHHATSTSRR